MKVECYTVLLGKQFMTYQRITVSSATWTSLPGRWRHYNPSKWWELLT